MGTYFQQYGTIDQTMPYAQGMSTIPGPDNDWNGTADGNPYCDGALWQYINPDTGKITFYICLTSAVQAAVWQALITQS